MFVKSGNSLRPDFTAEKSTEGKSGATTKRTIGTATKTKNQVRRCQIPTEAQSAGPKSAGAPGLIQFVLGSRKDQLSIIFTCSSQ